MSKELADLSQINDELKGALNLLEARLGNFPIKDSSQGNIVQETASLVQRCADIVGKKKRREARTKSPPSFCM